jgi:hypothetical protein
LASKNEHLTAILAMRVSWTTVDEMQATALASVRQWLKKARAMQDQYETQHATVQR